MKIAIVGCGEVGRTYARAAGDQGHELLLVQPRPDEALEALASSLKATIATAPRRDDFVGVERVWLCVTGDLTAGVFAEMIGALPAGVYVVDLTTAAAEDKRTCADLAAEHGLTYVDAVIMGAVAVTGAATPLLAAGSMADPALAEFRAFGAPVNILDGAHPGDAATIKLLRTILTKGLESLAVECLMAAERAGHRERLYDVLHDVDDMGFANFLDMLVRTHVQHAGRRLHEVERARKQLVEMGTPSLVLQGAQRRFEATAAALATHPPVPGERLDLGSSLAWLLSNP